MLGLRPTAFGSREYGGDACAGEVVGEAAVVEMVGAPKCCWKRMPAVPVDGRVGWPGGPGGSALEVAAGYVPARGDVAGLAPLGAANNAALAALLEVRAP